MRQQRPSSGLVVQNCWLSCLSCGRIVIFSLSLILVMTAPAFAQPLIDNVASIDSQVINADYVYVARIIKVRDEPIPGGSSLPGFTFEVEECLKLPVRETLDPRIKRRAMFVESPTTKYKDWMNRSSRLLIISSESSPQQPTVIELAPNKPDVFTADLRLLHDPNEIVAAAKDAIERTPRNVRRLRTHLVMLPREKYQGTPWENGQGVMLEVPADAHLEKWAIESLHHKVPWNRLRGAQALRYFKSERNAKLLIELLKDPASRANTDSSGTKTSQYYIREEAYQTLRRWGIEVKQPVLSREITKQVDSIGQPAR